MTVDRILEDLEEAGILVERVSTYHLFNEKMAQEDKTYVVFERGFYLIVTKNWLDNVSFSLVDEVGRQVLFWPGNGRDFLSIDARERCQVLCQYDWPKLLRCLRRVLS